MSSRLDKLESKVDKVDEKLDNIKQCSKCFEFKPLDKFYKASGKKNKFRARCKTCLNKESNEIEKKRRKVDSAYRQGLLDRMKARRSREDVKISTRIKSLLKEYNLTLEDYEKMFFEQEGSCKICRIHQKELSKRLFVDHCHKTGVVRGLLCSKCNHAIGLLQENSEIIIAAADYVRKYEK